MSTHSLRYCIEEISMLANGIFDPDARKEAINEFDVEFKRLYRLKTLSKAVQDVLFAERTKLRSGDKWEVPAAILMSLDLTAGAVPAVVRYTTAAENYDYGYCTTLESFEHDGNTWRKVRLATNTYRVNYQCARYQSGWYAVSETDPREAA